MQLLTGKQIAVLFLASILPFAAYYFHYWFVDTDGYYFLSHVCYGTHLDTPAFAHRIFDFLPCNEGVLKGVQFLALFISAILIAECGRLFNKRQGWIAGLVVFLVPWFVNEFFKFENDFLAYPYIALACFLFLWARRKDRPQYVFELLGLLPFIPGWLKFALHLPVKLQVWFLDLAALFILGATGFGIWGGVVFLILAMASNSLVFLLASAAAVAWNGWFLFDNLLPKPWVIESIPGISFFRYSFLLVPAIFGLRREYRWPLLLLFLASFLNGKWIWLAFPFLGVAAMVFLTKRWPKISFEHLGGEMRKTTGLWHGWLTVEYRIGTALKQFRLPHLVILCLVSSFLVGLDSFNQFPFPSQWAAVNDVVAKTGKDIVKNDWSFGYWLDWAAGTQGKAYYVAGEPNPPISRKGWAFTMDNLPPPCILDAAYNQTYAFGLLSYDPIHLFYCPEEPFQSEWADHNKE